MPRKVLSSFQVADTAVEFLEENGRMGLRIFPSASAGELAARRATLRGEPEIDALPGHWAPAASVLEPLVHLKLVGDSYSGAFAQGRTMRGSPSNERFGYQSQRVGREGDRTTVTTRFASREGLVLEHFVAWHQGDGTVEISTRLTNGSSAPVIVEMLSSFSLGCITPFDFGDAPNRLRVHRFRSVWSAEARLESRSVEELHLERSWSGAGIFS